LFSAGGTGTIAHPVEGLAWKPLALPAGSRLDSEQPSHFPAKALPGGSVRSWLDKLNERNQSAVRPAAS
jgi:hypothetical protein